MVVDEGSGIEAVPGRSVGVGRGTEGRIGAAAMIVGVGAGSCTSAPKEVRGIELWLDPNRRNAAAAAASLGVKTRSGTCSDTAGLAAVGTGGNGAERPVGVTSPRAATGVVGVGVGVAIEGPAPAVVSGPGPLAVVSPSAAARPSTSHACHVPPTLNP